MNYKEEGDKCFASGKYVKFYNNYKKYHKKIQSDESLAELNNAKKKYNLYVELCDFLKKDETKYYDILNVKKDASQKEIRDSYTKLISRYHPDKTKIKESNSVSRIIHKAYVILSNQKKRQEYDNSILQNQMPNFSMRDWRFDERHDFFRNVEYPYNTSFFWNVNNDEYTIFNNILYRNFFRYTPNRRLIRVGWNEHIYLKIIILLFLSYFILFI